jgi:hypothetical protein
MTGRVRRAGRAKRFESSVWFRVFRLIVIFPATAGKASPGAALLAATAVRAGVFFCRFWISVRDIDFAGQAGEVNKSHYLLSVKFLSLGKIR